MVQLANLRLAELTKIVAMNRGFYDEFRSFLNSEGYGTIKGFIEEESDSKAKTVIEKYLAVPIRARLYDGVANPYSDDKAKWYFLAWLMRDAPAQRLAPLLDEVPGQTADKRRAFLLNEVRKFVCPLLPKDENWGWSAISEVMLARLEGSRRSLKGNLFENLVRKSLGEMFDRMKLNLTISEKQVKIEGETYDVEVIGKRGDILMPVKTRETMGGGHANLFTRDIGKAIDVAKKHNHVCIPIVIAESWTGDLHSLGVKHFVYLKMNPNQMELIKAALPKELNRLGDVFRELGS